MALADRLNEAPTRSTGRPCSVGELEDTLTGKEADAFHAMLFTLGWSQEKIFEALKAEGIVVGKQTINRHRGRACKCFL